MIKEYKTINTIYNRTKKVAIIDCDNCHNDFQVDSKLADYGRKYCSLKCTHEGRGFKK